MPTNNVTDLITDQEMTLARFILSGTMTDRIAAETAGLDPASAAYLKSRPRVREYMLEHRAAVEKKLIEQDAQEHRRCSLARDRVLTRLWEIADLDPTITRNSASAQVKALSMIVAIEGLIPTRATNGRSAVAAENQPTTPPFYVSAWARAQQNGETADAAPSPEPAGEEPQQEAVAEVPSASTDVSAAAVPSNPAQATVSSHPPMTAFVPDSRIAFSLDRNRFGNKDRFGRPR
jgi:hypothetical protein